MSIKHPHEAAILAAMPWQARHLADTIGLVDALIFMDRLGGKRMFIPTELPKDQSHWLLRDFGIDLAEKLVRYFDGSHLEVPMLSSVERLLRDNMIRADFDEMCASVRRDEAMHALTERYRLTQRYLRKLLKASHTTVPRCVPGFEGRPIVGLLHELRGTDYGRCEHCGTPLLEGRPAGGAARLGRTPTTCG